MKKLILILLLFISGAIYSQTWQADTLVYYSSAYNSKPDTTIIEEIIITIEQNYLYVKKHNAYFKAKIVDTLQFDDRTGPYISDRIYTVTTIPKTYEGEPYTLKLIMSYFNSKLIAVGLLHGEQLFIYHIVNQLIDGYARK